MVRRSAVKHKQCYLPQVSAQYRQGAVFLCQAFAKYSKPLMCDVVVLNSPDKRCSVVVLRSKAAKRKPWQWQCGVLSRYAVARSCKVLLVRGVVLLIGVEQWHCDERLCAMIVSLLRDYNRITKRYTFGLVFATVDAAGIERPVLVVRGLTERKARQVMEYQQCCKS